MKEIQSEEQISEKEKERLTEVHRLSRIGFACFAAPAISILLMVVLIQLLAVAIYIDDSLTSMTSVGIILFGGTTMAYLLMFCVGLPAMWFLEYQHAGTLLNYVLFGIIAGMVCNICFWFMSIDQSSFNIQCGIMHAAVCWGIMNIGNQWSDKRYW